MKRDTAALLERARRLDIDETETCAGVYPRELPTWRSHPNVRGVYLHRPKHLGDPS